MGKKLVRIIITIIFAAIGASVARLILDSNAVSALSGDIMLWLPFAAYGVLVLLFGVIGFLLAPKLVTLYKKTIASLMHHFSDMPLSKIFVGVIGLAIALFLAFLLSSLPLRIQPQFVGVILCILMYLIFGTIGWLIPTRRIKEISLPSWLKPSEKASRIYAVSKVLDTSAIIDGRFFDIYKTGIVEGTVIIPQFVLDELRRIADSADAIKRARGRRGLELLDKIRADESSQSIIVSDQDYPDIDDVDSKLLRFAADKKCCIVTNDYNLNKTASVNRISVFNINDLANALRTNVTAGEDYIVTIMKEGKEPTQGVAYFDDGTMVVVEGARDLVGSTVSVTVTSVLQTSAGKMIFAKLKAD